MALGSQTPNRPVQNSLLRGNVPQIAKTPTTKKNAQVSNVNFKKARYSKCLR